MESLGIEHVYQGRSEKLPTFISLLEEMKLSADQAAYVGDDVVDLPIMRKVGLAIAVQDAHDLVKKHAHWQTPSKGGKGAARDICELIMEAQNTLDRALQKYL
jgi:3-deoxy-D-manno-octulosonate 8-phosphate phosphatase (KDO 8-P phosphatase)